MTMRDKNVLITGANRGIGKETTRALAKTGAAIVMACRNLAGAGPTCESIKQESGNPRVEVMHLDLASLDSVREFAGQFSQKHDRLDVLINNAGTFCPTREETRDGFEKTMGVNYLGPFLLTHLLLPIIVRTPDARIVNVASKAAFYGHIDLDDLHLAKRYHSFRAYAASKLAIVLFTRELAGCLQGTGVTVNALHPGHVATGMWPGGKWYLDLIAGIQRWFMISAEQGAETSVYLACSVEVAGISGEFFDDKRSREVPEKCRDVQLQKELWQLSEELTGLAGRAQAPRDRPTRTR